MRELALFPTKFSYIIFPTYSYVCVYVSLSMSVRAHTRARISRLQCETNFQAYKLSQTAEIHTIGC